MWRISAVLCVLTLFSVSCTPPAPVPPPDDTAALILKLPPYQGEQITIAVLDLNNQSDFDDPRIGRGIANMLTTTLVNSGRFVVVERNRESLQKLLEEQALGQTGLIDPATAARVGKMLGARGMVIGEVSDFGIRKTSAFTGFAGSKTITTRVVIDARLVNVETGRIALAATGIGESSTNSAGLALSFEFGTEGFDETTIGIATRKAVNQVVRQFAERLDQINPNQ